jgi:hypothetical protein
MKTADLHLVLRVVARGVKEFVGHRDARLTSHELRMLAIERRLGELETQYKGVWSADVSYAKGSMTTHAGSLWHSNVAENRTKPGESEQWTLCVKRGRDGRDARS